MKAGYHSLVPVPLFSLKQQRNLAKIFETSIKKGSRKPPLLPHNVPDHASTSNRRTVPLLDNIVGPRAGIQQPTEIYLHFTHKDNTFI